MARLRPSFGSRFGFIIGGVIAAGGLAGCQVSFDAIRTTAMIHSGQVYVLEEADGRVLVTPGLAGRVLTSTVGGVGSVGFVSTRDIEQGDRDVPFNNFGGQDRFWIGPESGSNGFYFPPNGEIDRDSWQVPEPLDRGSMTVLEDDVANGKLTLGRDMVLTSYSGAVFKLTVRREIGLIPSRALNEELGLPLPDGVKLIGSYSLNTLTNAGDAAWAQGTGIPCIWILGQFNAGSRTVVVAPFHAGTDDALGPIFDDTYFGKVSEVAPERLVVAGGAPPEIEGASEDATEQDAPPARGSAVLFRADASREGKFGLGPRRTTGVAGSWDPRTRLLVVVKFDTSPEEPLHASFHWGKDLPDAYKGDVFQSYNAGGDPPGTRNETHPFYELESVSPCRELGPGEAIVHRHATFAFTGSRDGLSKIAESVLGLSLDEIERAMP